MTATAPLVTIVGGSGFVGRYIAQAMARRGWRVRVAVRRPNEAHFVRPYGDVGQVEPVQANIRDEASLRRAVKGATAVVNCVGVLAESGSQSFRALQAEGAARAARVAADEGVERFVQISAIGADPESPSAYGRTKAEGEAAVREAFPDAVILRPSVVFGPEDEFFNRFASMSRFSPALPLVGAETKFQPVYVVDVAQAAAMAAVGEARPGIYELGGPRVATFRELMELLLEVIRRRRLILALPEGMAGHGQGLRPARQGDLRPRRRAADNRGPDRAASARQRRLAGRQGLRGARHRADGDGGGARHLSLAVAARRPVREDRRAREAHALLIRRRARSEGRSRGPAGRSRRA